MKEYSKLHGNYFTQYTILVSFYKIISLIMCECFPVEWSNMQTEGTNSNKYTSVLS